MERNLTNHASAGPTKYIWRKHWKFTTPHFLLVVQPWITIVTAPFFLPNVKYHTSEREKDKKDKKKDKKDRRGVVKKFFVYFRFLQIKDDDILILNIVLIMKRMTMVKMEKSWKTFSVTKQTCFTVMKTNCHKLFTTYLMNHSSWLWNTFQTAMLTLMMTVRMTKVAVKRLLYWQQRRCVGLSTQGGHQEQPPVNLDVVLVEGGGGVKRWRWWRWQRNQCFSQETLKNILLQLLLLMTAVNLIVEPF